MIESVSLTIYTMKQLIDQLNHRSNQQQHTWTRVTEFSEVEMLSLVADGIVEHTAVGVFILIFHLQR